MLDCLSSSKLNSLPYIPTMLFTGIISNALSNCLDLSAMLISSQIVSLKGVLHLHGCVSYTSSLPPTHFRNALSKINQDACSCIGAPWFI